MAVRKNVEESFVINGKREDWLKACEDSLKNNGFKDVKLSSALFQIEASYKKATTWGVIQITLQPEGENTRIIAKATANVDNIFALFKSPGKTIIDSFKKGIVHG